MSGFDVEPERQLCAPDGEAADPLRVRRHRPGGGAGVRQVPRPRHDHPHAGQPVSG